MVRLLKIRAIEKYYCFSEGYMTKLNLGILASHGGSNMQSIIDACTDGVINAKVCVVISNNSSSYALERSRNENIPCYHLSSKKYPEEENLDKAILSVLRNCSVDTILLAGYMKKLGKKVLSQYKGRILNIHPALLPKYGGKGKYGNYVHEAVLNAGEKKTGVTIHIVDEEYDTGKIINQCEVEVREKDTIETLSQRVLEREHTFYVETLKLISEGKIEL